MKVLFEKWLVDNYLSFTLVQENIYLINDSSYLLLKEKNGLIINQKFSLILDKEEEGLLSDIDFVVYLWGDKFLYTPKDKIKSPEFNFLRYIGKIEQESYPFLGIHGKYELLNGSRDYELWCKKASFLNIKTLGICEKNTLAGVLDFQEECKKNNINSIIGETITIKVENNFYLGKVFVLNEIGWKNLLLINSDINVINPDRYVDEVRLLELSEGLVFIFHPAYFPFSSLKIKQYLTKFSECYFQLDSCEYNNPETDENFIINTNKYLKSSLNPILISDAYYLEKEDKGIKSALNSLSGERDLLSESQWFKTDDENFNLLRELFQENSNFEEVIIKSISSLLELESKCNFEIETGKFKLPQYKMTEDELKEFKTVENLFFSVIEEGFQKKIIEKGLSEQIYSDRLEEEIRVIQKGGFEDYFLILWDIINFCQKNNILTGIGRGSAAGSLVAYLMGLTKIDPIPYGLLFARFLNEGRIGKSLPDVDTDFEALKKPVVKNYLEQKYGQDKVCSIGTYTTLQIKAALKDLSRLKGVDIGTVELVSKLIGSSSEDGRFFREPWEYIFQIALKNPIIKQFVESHPDIVSDIELVLGQPKAASVHPCATLILPENESIFTSVPIRKGEVNGEKLLVSEWEGEFIEKAGYLKEDILGINQLDKFRMIIDLVKENYKEDIDIYSLPLNEPEVYKMFQEGYCGDVFHLGSKSLTKYGIEVVPEKIEDLIAILAVYRPGPIEGNAHNDLVSLRHGEKQPDFYPGTELITKETYSLIIYQEQIMQICQKIGGFSLVEADDIRKAMGKLNQKLLDSYKDRWFEGALKNGYSESVVQELWDKMVAFGGYAFNKCFSGKEKIFRTSINQYKSDFTIEEMYKIRNDYSYAKLTGHLSLRDQYRRNGYGFCFSLDSKNRLIKNKIVDIRYEGIRVVFEVTTESGRKIRTTDNHRYPTSNGEKKLCDINMRKDQLFISSGRVKGNEKGYLTHFEKIISIEMVGGENVYDVEVSGEVSHTLLLESGIVASNSHSAAYAITGYICQYLKWKYPLPYWITALEFASDDNVLRFLSEIYKGNKIKVMPPDINKSDIKFKADFSLNQILWSISRVKQCGPIAVKSIFDERDKNGEFFSLQEFLERVEKSKVNKSVVENLILAGAFDSLENIQTPSERSKLITKYREIANVKAGKEDWFNIAKSGLNFVEDWFWVILQKRVSGLAFLSYYDLVVNKLNWNIRKYLSVNEITNKFNIKRDRIITAGFVQEIEEKESKKGSWMKVLVEQNYEYTWLYLWSELYVKFADQIRGSEGKIIIFNGRLVFDDFKKENVIQAEEDFQIEILS